MTAYEFYRVPSWVFPTAAVIGPDGRQAGITHIEWNARSPDIYYRYDGEEHDRRLVFAEFCGRCRPLWDAEGRQVVSTVGERRKMKLGEFAQWSTRTRNVFVRSGWNDLTVGEFLLQVTLEDLRRRRGAGKGVVTEVLSRLAEAGFAMRKYDEGGEEAR